MTHEGTSESCRDWVASMLRGEACRSLPALPQEIIDVAMNEGVATLLLAAMGTRETAANDAIVTALFPGLSDLVRNELAVEMIRRAEIKRVTSGLLHAGVPFLMLKGAALAYRVYGEPHQRPRCDLDLLMPTMATVSSAEPLLESLGYEGGGVRSGLLMANEIQWRRQAPGGTVQWIDAHWALTNNQLFGTRFAYEELERDSVPVPGFPEGVRGLGDVHALIHACLHRVANMAFGAGDRLIWLYDVLLLATRLSPADWERLADIAKSRGVAGPVLGGIEAAAHWLACPQPEPVLQRLRNAAADERFDMQRAHRRVYMEWQEFLAIPMRLRARWIWQKLFPSAAYVGRWGDSRDPVTAADYGRRLRNISRLFSNP